MVETLKWKKSLHQTRRTLAKFWLGLNPQVIVVGVTGSYGKTNTTRAIATVLSEKYKTLQTDLNLDTVYNLPITLLKLRPWHQKLVLEYGVDHKNEMDFHLSLVKPSIAVVTGINPTHSEAELLGSLEGVIKEKSKLLQALPDNGWAILNWDDKNVRPMAKKTKAKIYWYGISPCIRGDPPSESEGRQVFWADKIKVDFRGTNFSLHHDGKELKVETGLIGQHFVYACLVAAAVGVIEGLNWQEIKTGLAKVKPLKGRLNIEKGPNGSILINDALRANPASAMAGLEVLADLPRQPAGRRIAVLGEMGELGVLAKKSHQEVGKKVANLKIDYLVSVGPLQKFTSQEAINGGMNEGQVFWVKDVSEAADVLKTLLKKGDLLYLKGSLLRHMERVLLILAGKKVGCKRTNCHFYQQCPACPELQKIS